MAFTEADLYFDPRRPRLTKLADDKININRLLPQSLCNSCVKKYVVMMYHINRRLPQTARVSIASDREVKRICLKPRVYLKNS